MTPRPLAPPATLGMLGGGQLGRFALMAARSLGYSTVVLDPDPAAPAGAVADEHLIAAFDDQRALDRLAVTADVVTTEFENPPEASLRYLEGVVPVAPSARIVGIAQDRRAEKAFLDECGFAIAPYRIVADAGVHIEGPHRLKTARLGYDGKGQRRVSTTAELQAAWAELGAVPCVVERELGLDIEISVLVARTADARTVTYPVAENRHVAGILDLSVVPARVPAAVADRAVGIAMAIADALDYVGVLAVECFVVDGEVLVNELAPRPHNSGHWTLDGSRTSQFEQQVRAVCGLGLGSTEMSAPAVAMVNLLGDLWADGEPDWSSVLEHPDAKLHLYGKHQARPGRKMGHLSVLADHPGTAETLAVGLRSALRPR